MARGVLTQTREHAPFTVSSVLNRHGVSLALAAVASDTVHLEGGPFHGVTAVPGTAVVLSAGTTVSVLEVDRNVEHLYDAIERTPGGAHENVFKYRGTLAAQPQSET